MPPRGGVLLEDSQWRQLATAGSGQIPPSARSVVEAGAPGRAQRITAGKRRAGLALALRRLTPRRTREILLRLAAAAIGVEMARDGAGVRERKRGFWESL